MVLWHLLSFGLGFGFGILITLAVKEIKLRHEVRRERASNRALGRSLTEVLNAASVSGLPKVANRKTSGSGPAARFSSLIPGGQSTVYVVSDLTPDDDSASDFSDVPDVGDYFSSSPSEDPPK